MKLLIILWLVIPLAAQHGATGPSKPAAKPPAARAMRNPFAGKPAEAEAGRGMFRIYCAACHGILAKGGSAPDLTRGSWSVGSADEDLFRIIANGSPGTEMPGYSERLADEQIWRFVSFIRAASTAKPEVPKGNAARGHAIYAKAGCANCHLIGDAGGSLGPALTQVGRSRTLTYLRESLVDPSADLGKNSRYAGVTLVTSSGEKLSGRKLDSDLFSIRIADPRGRYHSFLRSELQSVEVATTSLMPSYQNSLSPAELDDLVAYLYILGKEKAAR